MKKLTEKLNDSPINYFSDLFIVAMVIGWIVILIIMVIVGIWATVKLEDTSIWAYVWELTGIPLTAGGAIWMIKNSVQHSIANKQGKRAHMDFPKVDASEEIDGMEEPMDFTSDDEENDDISG